jgi:hemolysin D
MSRRSSAPRKTSPGSNASTLDRLRRWIPWRKQDNQQIFIQGSILDYREFLPAAAEVTESPPSPTRLGFAWTICGLVVVSLLLSWIGRVDIYAVAPGRVQPAGRSKIIQPFGIGTVRAIHVHDGQFVKAGSLLVELDPTDADADSKAASSSMSALNAEIARRRAVMEVVTSGNLSSKPAIAFPTGTEFEFQQREISVFTADMLSLSSKVEYLQAKLQEIRSQLVSLKATVEAESRIIDTLQKRVQMRTSLQQQGWESLANVLDATETLQREVATRSRDEGQILQNESSVQSLGKQIKQAISEFAGENSQGLEKAENQRDAALQTLVKARAKSAFTRLISPIDGTIQQLAVTTVGQVVMSGEQLMTIVPTQNHLEMVALLQNQDVGFVQVGQEAVIKIDSFPFTRYGTLVGNVTRISRDSVHNREAQESMDTQHKPIASSEGGASPVPMTMGLVFPVTLALKNNTIMVDGRLTPVSPGMSGTVEIKTGNQRVLEYILSPLVRLKSESIHER